MKTSSFAAASVLARRVLGLGLILSAFAGSSMALEIPKTPEIDPGSISSALTLLAGGLFLFKNRRAAR